MLDKYWSVVIDMYFLINNDLVICLASSQQELFVNKIIKRLTKRRSMPSYFSLPYFLIFGSIISTASS